MDLLSGHDPLTTHHVQSVLALEGGRIGAVFGRADSNTELVVGHVAGCQHGSRDGDKETYFIHSS